MTSFESPQRFEQQPVQAQQSAQKMNPTPTSSTTSCNTHRAINFAVECNNIGVQLLRINDNGCCYRSEAYELFQGSLDIMKQISSPSSGQITNNEFISRSKELLVNIQQCEEVFNTIKQNYNILPKAPKRTSYPVAVQSNCNPSKSLGFVYKFGLLVQSDYISHFTNSTIVDEETCGQQQHHESLYSMISSIIIYNMALVHHLSYLDEQDDEPVVTSNNDHHKAYDDDQWQRRQEKLQQHQILVRTTIDLYEKSFSLLNDACSYTSNPQSSMLDLRMVIVNNIAVVYHDMQQYTRSKFYLTKLSYFISYAMHIINKTNIKTKTTCTITTSTTSAATTNNYNSNNTNDHDENGRIVLARRQQQEQQPMFDINNHRSNNNNNNKQREEQTRRKKRRLGISIGNGFFEHFTLNVLYLKEPSFASAA